MPGTKAWLFIMKRISHKDLQVGQEYVAIRTNMQPFVKMYAEDGTPAIRIRFKVSERESEEVCEVFVLESDAKNTCSAAFRILKSLQNKEPVRIKLGMPMYSLYEITKGVRRGKINMVKRKRV